MSETMVLHTDPQMRRAVSLSEASDGRIGNGLITNGDVMANGVHPDGEDVQHDISEMTIGKRTPWTSPKSVLKSVGPKLVPFCKTVVIYFVLSFPESSPIFFRCMTKCAPIISLIIFVLLHGINLSKEYAFARAILCGLIMSLFGDIFLCYNLLIFGMLFFGLAHANYIRAFGLRPLKLYVLLVLSTLTAGAYAYLLPHLEWPMCIFVIIYFILISVMGWRALARVQLFDELWTWTKLCSSAGAILFMISDLLLAIHKFVTPLTYERELIMGTYYAAQLGIALSVVDSRKARKTD